jgi:hypothetical protein
MKTRGLGWVGVAYLVEDLGSLVGMDRDLMDFMGLRVGVEGFSQLQDV